MNTWSFYELQRQIEYKAKWVGLPVKHVKAHGTSSKMVFQKNDINYICNEYLNDKSANKIAKEYHTSHSVILRILKENNIKKRNRTYDLNEDFFETIDSEAKAYFLGLLFADGYHNELKNRIQLSLQTKDKELVLKFKDVLNAENTIFFEKHRNITTLSFASKKISNDLINLGLRQKKTFTCRVPEIPKYLMRHFVRGYFDGDGCACISNTKNRKKLTCSFAGNKSFLTKLIQQFPFETTSSILPKSSIYEFRTSKKETLYSLYCWLYDSSSIFPRRKYEKWNLGLRVVCGIKLIPEEHRVMRCIVCRILIDRDENAAKNILARGLRFDPNAPQVGAMKQFKDVESMWRVRKMDKSLMSL